MEAEDLRILANSNEELNTATTLVDYSTKSWYEYLGFNYPANEREYQQQTGIPTGIPNVIGDRPDISSSFDFGNIALIGAALIIGIMVLKQWKYTKQEQDSLIFS